MKNICYDDVKKGEKSPIFTHTHVMNRIYAIIFTANNIQQHRRAQTKRQLIRRLHFVLLAIILCLMSIMCLSRISTLSSWLYWRICQCQCHSYYNVFIISIRFAGTLLLFKPIRMHITHNSIHRIHACHSTHSRMSLWNVRLAFVISKSKWRA